MIPFIEKIAEIISLKVGNPEKDFFKLQTICYLSFMASSLRVNFTSPMCGKSIPVNIFGVNLAPSGFGKGNSTRILEQHILHKFKDRFINKLFPKHIEQSLLEQALKQYQDFTGDTESSAEDLLAISDKTFDDIYQELIKENDSYGSYVWTFDSATVPALKQLRNSLLRKQIGAINTVIDEIGSNLSSSVELLTVFLELYDLGITKNKLLKVTNEQKRYKDLEGKSPTNLLAFGTPHSLFDGGEVEKLFINLLKTGYARRCFFTYHNKVVSADETSIDDAYAAMVNTANDDLLEQAADYLASFATETWVNKEIIFPQEIDKKLFAYRKQCELLADDLPADKEILATELKHRFFKTAKLAALLAFLQKHNEVTEQDLEHAIAYTEECGKTFVELMQRPPAYARLALYLAEYNGQRFNDADLLETLPFFPKTKQERQNIVNLAASWGMSNNIMLNVQDINGIPTYSASKLTPADTDKLIVAYSEFMGSGYLNQYVSLKELSTLVTTDGYNFLTFHSKNGNRNDNAMLDEFNLIAFDIDSGSTLSYVKELLRDYMYLIYTTRNHQKEKHGTICDRFRILLPLNYNLKLQKEGYQEFIKNILKILPINDDTQTIQPSRLWYCNGEAEVFMNENGKLFDAIPFLPFRKEFHQKEAMMKEVKAPDDVIGLYKWFLFNMQTGNRNGMFFRFAMVLLDKGYSYDEIRNNVLSLNDQLSLIQKEPLSVNELETTVLSSIKSRL